MVKGQFTIELDPENPRTLSRVEREYVEAVFRMMDGNKALTARALGVDRRTLYRKLEAWGLHDRSPRK